MILTRMPDLSCDSFRKAFYARWGKENAVVMARTRHISMPPWTQRLSIKAAYHGCEDYFLERRRIRVDDESYLILNDARTYGSRIDADNDILSLAIFFRPGMAAEVLTGMITPVDRLLEDPLFTTDQPVQFAEHLLPHDRLVTPLLRHIARCVQTGTADETWLEEQLQLLLERMLYSHRRLAGRALRLSAVRASTRAELLRRLMRAADYIHSNYEREIGIDDMASSACLSRYYFIRLFRQVHGSTPYHYLRDKRIRVARRLLRNTGLTMSEVAPRVGLRWRASLSRMLHPKRAAPAALSS